MNHLGHQFDPFEYSLFDRVFSDHSLSSLISWLKAVPYWELTETDFFEQFEFSVDEMKLPDSVAFLNRADFRDELAKTTSDPFGVEFLEQSSLIAHKLLPGQHIGIHNDVIEGGESHRLTVQLNEGLQGLDGGYFMLFDSCNAAEVHRVLKPVSNSGIAFAISEKSNHAVTHVHNGVRFSLVFSFHER